MKQAVTKRRVVDPPCKLILRLVSDREILQEVREVQVETLPESIKYIREFIKAHMPLPFDWRVEIMMVP